MSKNGHYLMNLGNKNLHEENEENEQHGTMR
jgi:hypothetical protein